MKKRKHLIIGDCHSCADELQELIDNHLDKNLMLVGDAFDRGFYGVAVFDKIQKYNIRMVLGNHEKKALDFLEGRRSWIPAHYSYFFREFEKKYDLEILKDYIRGLPLIIEEENFILAHGGVNIDNPSETSVSFNVYGGFPPDFPMPAGVDRKTDWWNLYPDDSKLVIYGHITHKEPLVKPSSIGIDTGAVHGEVLTGYCPEENAFYQVKSKRNYFKELKEVMEKEKREAKQKKSK